MLKTNITLNKIPLSRIALLCLLALTLGLNSCASYRKLQAAKVLKNCAYSFNSAQINKFTPSEDLIKISQDGGMANSSLAIIETIKSFIDGDIGSSLGTVDVDINVNVLNPNEKELQIDSIQAIASADGFKFPIKMKEKAMIKSDAITTIPLNLTMDLDSNIFNLSQINSINLSGRLFITTGKKKHDSLPINVDQKISQEDKTKIYDSIRETIINNMVSGWMQNLVQ